MKSLKECCLEFKYDGKSLSMDDYIAEQSESENTINTVYYLEDGLKITNIVRKYEEYDAYESVNYLENISQKPTGILSEVWDAVCSIPLGFEKEFKMSKFVSSLSDGTIVYAPNGSCCRFFEFYSKSENEVFAHVRQRHIHVGETWEFTASGGRSSEEQAPFFNIHKEGKGVIFAIGWSGQWKCSITRNENDVKIKTKIEDTNFRIMPGEKIRTSSIVVMPYECDVMDSHVKWRRLIKDNFSLLGLPGRDKYAPLCAETWGGSTTESLLQMINVIKENKLPFEYFWIDAGWYGAETKPNESAFTDEWKVHTGDWRVSKYIHPNLLKDVSEVVHNAGMKFLLWFEPERVIYSTPIAMEHPEYLLSTDTENNSKLLNLGNEEAWEWCYNTLCNIIEELKIDCLRIDFNMSPLGYWRKNDSWDRRGITEIKYINGLYRLMDMLLEKYPHLLIDNCASGGRRIDIETLRRSVPLWRSDFMCARNYEVAASQTHHTTYNTWMPYSGTSTGSVLESYRFRSAYDSGLCIPPDVLENSISQNNDDGLEFLKVYLNEYLSLRPYFSADFYPLTKVSEEMDVWQAMQFDRPKEADGIVQVFRREDSPYETACFALHGIDKSKNYIFTDIDDGSQVILSGTQLYEAGFLVTIKEKRMAKIYLYKES